MKILEKKRNRKDGFMAKELSLEDKKRILEVGLGNIEKQFGKGAVMKLGDKPALDIDVISSGSLKVNEALGIGGYPKGRIIEIYGPESSGKTTLALHAVAEAQKAGGLAAFVDVEHAIDPVYAGNLGVNTDDLYLSQPDSGEQALEIVEQLVQTGAVDLIVLDSVAALVPQAEIDGEMGDFQVGLQARLMSKAMRKLNGVISKTNCTAIFINQIREKVGIVYGNPETTPGGRALKFYSSVRIEIRKSEALKDGSNITGNKTNIKIVKNKVAPPFKTAQVEIMYGKGISYIGELIDACADANVIKKAGSWYSYKENKIGQGKESVRTYLNDNPDIVEILEQELAEAKAATTA